MKIAQGILRFVVDANILRSAGDKEATHPDAREARDVLRDILEICHHVVLSEEAHKEWIKHQSPIGSIWAANMKSRGKIEKVELELLGYDQVLSSTIEDENILAARRKDLHLVIAALRHGNCIIISNDRRAANGFDMLSDEIPEFGRLEWWGAGCTIPPRYQE